LFFRVDEALSRLLSEKGLTKLLADFDLAAKGMADILDDENRAALKQTIKDLADVVHTASAQKALLEQSLKGAAHGAENFDKLTTSLNEQVPALVARVNKSAAALNAMTDDLSQTSKAVRGIVSEARPELQQFSQQTLPEIGLLVTELRQLAGTLTRVARELEREPNAFLFGRKKPTRGPGE
jgi:phospholipid/cholesterol/gamma-HCH transport system substrate-binding protein